MPANVRCAGGGQVAKDPAPFGLGPTHYERPTGGAPCGWKGERFAIGHVTRREADTLPIAELQARMLANQNTLRTAKPCPRCGGRVELIPTGGAA
ncbi:MAG TPA: hypothetical protein VF933_16695 [Streptosporangiaceae bacterium]